jgi:uncharacterized protein YfaS (alpha-2-macroglobulin family)
MTKRIAGQMNRGLSLIVLVALLLAGCGPLTPEPTPTAPEPTSKPTTAPPTETPPPTATPLPLPAPSLLFRSPEPGEELAVEAPLELTFDQPMDRASVEAATTISPTVETTAAWADDRTVAFSPAAAGAGQAGGQWDRGGRYEVTIVDMARNVEGLAMEEPVSFMFSTAGDLNVSQVIPTADTEGLDPDTTVTVFFDRPVVPLTSLSNQAGLPQPLTFVPPVRGEGEWLNTSIYVFRPSEGLLPATHYKARVAAGLEDTSGSVLEEDYTWEFTTIQPVVLDVWPPSNFDYLGPTDVISVTFNQPMDHASAQTHFSLELDGQAVEGTFRWRGAGTPTAPDTLIFQPGEALPRDTRLVARVSAGAQARVGAVGLAEDKVWRFATVREPGVERTSPRDGQEDVEPSGGMQITFASPMQRAGFLDHLTIRPQVTEVYSYWSEYDTEVFVSFEQEPATAYRVSLDEDTPDRYSAPLGQAALVRFRTGDLSPFATLNTGGRLGAVSAYTDTVVYATHRNVSRLELGLYRLSPTTFMQLNADWEAWDRFRPDEDDAVRQWTQIVEGERNQFGMARVDLVDEAGDALRAGLYYVELSAPEVRERVKEYQPSRYMFVRSRLNLTLKQSRTQALVWAADLASGQPVVGAPVTFYQGKTRLSASGATDRDGLFQVGDLRTESLWDAFFAMTGEPGDEGFGIAYNGWDEGISPWNFDLESEYWGSDYQGYLYTERPIYRPGQTVYFKGIVRADDDARYTLPADIKRLKVRVSDPQGKELYKSDLDLNDMGTLHDELVLSEEAPLGNYYLEIQDEKLGLYAGTSFLVAEYRKPDFEVSVAADKGAYLGGETINLTAEAAYYFGGPVANAAVHWSVLSSPYSFTYQCPRGQICPWYSWSDFEWGSYDEQYLYGGYGRLVAEGDARTDGQGRVTFRVPADIAQETQSQVFTIEASVTDLNGQQVSNRTAAIVHKGEFYAGVAPRDYVAQVGEETEVDLLTVDWDSQPVAQVPLSLTFLEHRWYSVRRQAEDGAFYWEWTAEDTPVLTTTVTTGADGQATASFVPEKAGSYRVRTEGRDSSENEIRSSTYIWVWGGDETVSWRQESNNRIELIADKDEYLVGDVAEILIPSPYTGTVQALVTVERGRVIETEVRELESNTEIVRVLITGDQVPNTFVSVVIVQGSEQAADGLASFKMGLVKLPVSVASKELSITLTPDKNMEMGEHYGPRQTATYDVLVTDHEGKPVEAELSMRLADLAVLALADDPGPTLLAHFWRSRGLGVKTSTPLVVALEQFNRELRPEAKGGGGGEAGGLIRRQFADTAFWDPVVRTSSDGRAQVTVQLPDDLTTWRMQARGVTANTEVGQAEVDVVSSLELLVRPVLPRFFIAGDQAQIATIVQNNTGEALEVEVSISAEGLTLAGQDSQQVSVSAGGQAEVVWPVEVLPGDEVQVRMWARETSPAAGREALYDGREDVLPIYRYSTPEVMATAGSLPEPGLRQEIIQLPPVFDPTQGGLTVQLDASLAAASQDALNYLEHYPYECVEQTVSRFLPNVVTWRVMDEMGLERTELRQKLAQMVGVALQRLYNEQHYDGGWGWWVSDQSDPYLTAYVLHGMLEAHRGGFVVDVEVMARGANHLWEQLPSVSQIETHAEANRLAYQLYVLADYGITFEEESQGELGLAIRLFDRRHLLDHYGQATLAVALGLLEPDETARVKTLLSDLAGSAVVSATGTHWEEARADYWNMNTEIRTTAMVVWAFSRFEEGPEDNGVMASGVLPEGSSDLTINAIRWLMAARKEGYWETTQATAWTLLALGEYMRASGEMAGDFSYTVYLNGEELASRDVTEQNIDQSHKVQVEIARLLLEAGAGSQIAGGSRLVIERHPAGTGQTGEGQLAYTAQLRYYLPADQVQALERGIVVARQYSPVDPKTGTVAATGEYVDSAQVGDLIQVKLTLLAPTDLHYVVVEDPLPAGFEGVDLSLKTTSVVGEPPELRRLLSASERRDWYGREGWGWWWFSHSEMRDEKTVLFATYLPRGTYEYTYLMRAGVVGEFLVPPANAYEMYFPEVFGRSDGGKFTVEAGE